MGARAVDHSRLHHPNISGHGVHSLIDREQAVAQDDGLIHAC